MVFVNERESPTGTKEWERTFNGRRNVWQNQGVFNLEVQQKQKQKKRCPREN